MLPGKGVIFMKGLVFDTENRIQFKNFGEPLLDSLQKEVGGYIEVVHPKYLPEGLCMVVDDEGRLKGYDSKTFAVWVEGNWFGITYAFITHSHYESKPFDQKMTPYTVEGRRRYVSYRTKHKPLPCDRPSVNSPSDIAISAYARGRMNFEYYMNREYAYSRDKGKCKCCGNAFSPMLQKNCHHVKNKLPLDRINKVPNLVWLCEPCHRMVHNSPIPTELNAKTVGKIMKYREKLKT